MRTYQLAGNIPVVGVQGEINAARIEIDASDFLQEMPDGTAVLVCRRADGMIFPMASETDEAGMVTALLGAAETAVEGRIEFELRWYEGEKLAKSRIYSGTIARTIGEPDVRPEDPGTEWIGQLFDEQSRKEPKHGHPYALDGANLKEVFGNADNLYAALAEEDYSKIHNLDYYPIKFEGSYRDYGEWMALAGTNYYSDTACKNVAGQIASDTVVAAESASPAYYSATISGTKRYVRMQDCQRWRAKTINMTAKMEANINVYWRYGNGGNLSNGVPHIMWLARDGIASLKFRSSNLQWADAVEQFATGDGTTATYTPTDAAQKCVRYVCVDGALQTYNTAYTVNTSTGAVTFKSGYIPASGAAILISRTTHDHPWNGSAVYKTFNDPTYGLLRLIDDAEFAAHIYGGADGSGMRYGEETRTVANSTGVSWADRGKMFLPIESEVWGLAIYGSKDTWYHLPQLPVFANGGKRRISKAASDGGSRNYWLTSSTASTVNIALIGGNGNPNNDIAATAYTVVPGMVGV